MRVVLTGHAGYLGACLLAVLGADGHDVILPNQDLTTASKLASCDVLVHAAGATRGSRRALWSSNVDALSRVLTLIGTTPVVHISSRAVYASAPGCYVSESASLAPVDPYGASKLCAEQVLRCWGGPALVLRPSALIGVGVDGRTNAASAVDRMIRSGVTTGVISCASPTSYIDSLSVWELGKVVADLLRHEAIWGQVFNVAGPATNVCDVACSVADQVSSQCGRDCVVVRSGTASTTAPTLLECTRLRSTLGWLPAEAAPALVPSMVGTAIAQVQVAS